MDCSRTKELLSDYIDGILDKEHESLVRDHLLQCGDCRNELESMKAVIREIGSLDKVKAPGDFLAALHGRMERESWFQKVKNFLFMPARIRIPVELATLATTVVLAFFIFHIVQFIPLKGPADLKDKKVETEIRSSESAPISDSGPKASGQALKADRIMPEPPKKQNSVTVKAMPATPLMPPAAEAPKAIDADQLVGYGKTEAVHASPESRKPLEMVLLLEPSGGKESLSSDSRKDVQKVAEKTSQMPAPVRLQARTKAGAAEVTGRDETPPAGKSYEAKDNTILYKEGLFENIGEHIKNAGGILLKTDMNKDTGQPEYLLIEIQSHNYLKLIEKLAGFGKVQAPVSGDSGQTGEPVQVRIRIISSN